MAATWYVKADPIVGISIEEPQVFCPEGVPQFGPTKLDCQATSWIDDIFRIFLPLIEADPNVEFYVEVGNGADDWAMMRAWVMPRTAPMTTANLS